MPSNERNQSPLDLLSLNEVAQLLKRPVAAIAKLVDNEELRAFRFGDQDEVVRVLRLDAMKHKQACRVSYVTHTHATTAYAGQRGL